MEREMSCRQFLPLVALALAVVVGSVRAEAATVLENTCNYVSNYTAKGISYEFCVTSLQVDARSRSAADASVLGLVAVELAVANATHAQAKIKSLLDSPRVEPSAKTLLNICAGLYDDMRRLFDGAAKDMAAKAYKGASAQLGQGAGKPASCDNVLYEGGEAELMSKENVDCSQLADISNIVVASLLHAYK